MNIPWQYCCLSSCLKYSKKCLNSSWSTKCFSTQISSKVRINKNQRVLNLGYTKRMWQDLVRILLVNYSLPWFYVWIFMPLCKSLTPLLNHHGLFLMAVCNFYSVLQNLALLMVMCGSLYKNMMSMVVRADDWIFF